MARTTKLNGASKVTERLSINVSHMTAQALRDLSQAKSTTITEVIRRAVAVLKVLEDAQNDGAELHLVRPDDGVVHVLHLV